MRNSNRLLIIVICLLVLAGFLIYRGLKPLNFNLGNQTKLISSPVERINSPVTQTSTGSASIQEENFPSYPVVKVVDGDTIEVNIDGKNAKVRFIGVNTPETVDPRRPVQCFGKEASDETKQLLTGKSVILTKDVSETDKYGRLLRFVYVKLDDGKLLFVNDYLVREGFAQVSTYPPDVKFASRFLAAQTEAESGNKGLWGKCEKK